MSADVLCEYIYKCGPIRVYMRERGSGKIVSWEHVGGYYQPDLSDASHNRTSFFLTCFIGTKDSKNPACIG